MRHVAIALFVLVMGSGQAMGQGLYGANGTRSFTWPNGDTFVGEFRGGLPNGPGTMRYANGEIFSGVWIDGCLQVGLRRFAVFTTLRNCPRGLPVLLPQQADR